MPTVAIKSAEQQSIQSLHRVRTRLIADRTAAANQIRSVVAEQGLVCAQGIRRLTAWLSEILSQPTSRLDGVTRKLIGLYLEQIDSLNKWIAETGRQIEELFARSEVCQRLARLAGVGPITATAVLATVADARSYRNGRQFAAWLGLTPRQKSSGGKNVLLGITKRGDTYLRTLSESGHDGRSSPR